MRCLRVHAFLEVRRNNGRRCKSSFEGGQSGTQLQRRFQSQHYSPRAAPSTLAATLLKTKVLWSFIGISSLDESNVRSLIEQNTDRDNFLLASEDAHLLGKLETYLKGRLGSVFEGGTE